MTVSRILALPLLWAVACWVGPAAADVWSYEDDDGRTHYTATLEQVPERYQDRAEEVSGTAYSVRRLNAIRDTKDKIMNPDTGKEASWFWKHLGSRLGRFQAYPERRPPIGILILCLAGIAVPGSLVFMLASRLGNQELPSYPRALAGSAGLFAMSYALLLGLWWAGPEPWKAVLGMGSPVWVVTTWAGLVCLSVLLVARILETAWRRALMVTLIHRLVCLTVAWIPGTGLIGEFLGVVLLPF